jgi:hypothetical protein
MNADANTALHGILIVMVIIFYAAFMITHWDEL